MVNMNILLMEYKILMLLWLTSLIWMLNMLIQIFYPLASVVRWSRTINLASQEQDVLTDLVADFWHLNSWNGSVSGNMDSHINATYPTQKYTKENAQYRLSTYFINSYVYWRIKPAIYSVKIGYYCSYQLDVHTFAGVLLKMVTLEVGAFKT